MDTTPFAETAPTDSEIIATAKRLSERYGMAISVTHTHALPNDWRSTWTVCGGEHTSNPTPTSFAVGTGNALEEAESLFVEDREKLSLLDPLADIRKKAAAAGFDLVPLDLKQSTARNG